MSPVLVLRILCQKIPAACRRAFRSPSLWAVLDATRAAAARRLLAGPRATDSPNELSLELVLPCSSWWRLVGLGRGEKSGRSERETRPEDQTLGERMDGVPGDAWPAELSELVSLAAVRDCLAGLEITSLDSFEEHFDLEEGHDATVQAVMRRCRTSRRKRGGSALARRRCSRIWSSGSGPSRSSMRTTMAS